MMPSASAGCSAATPESSTATTAPSPSSPASCTGGTPIAARLESSVALPRASRMTESTSSRAVHALEALLRTHRQQQRIDPTELVTEDRVTTAQQIGQLVEHRVSVLGVDEHNGFALSLDRLTDVRETGFGGRGHAAEAAGHQSQVDQAARERYPIAERRRLAATCAVGIDRHGNFVGSSPCFEGDLGGEGGGAARRKPGYPKNLVYG